MYCNKERVSLYGHGTKADWRHEAEMIRLFKGNWRLEPGEARMKTTTRIITDRTTVNKCNKEKN